MNYPAASCEVSRFRCLIDFIEAGFEEYNPERLNEENWPLFSTLELIRMEYT
jgi:hypothetical protein